MSNVKNSSSKYEFYAGQIRDNDAEDYKRNHELYSLGTDIFNNVVNYSAFGDNLKVEGKGTLIMQPSAFPRERLIENEPLNNPFNLGSHVKEAMYDDNVVIVAYVKAVKSQHVYHQDGVKKIRKYYMTVPIYASSPLTKNALLNLNVNDTIWFKGAFTTPLLKNSNSDDLPRSTFWCRINELNQINPRVSVSIYENNVQVQGFGEVDEDPKILWDFDKNHLHELKDSNVDKYLKDKRASVVLYIKAAINRYNEIEEYDNDIDDRNYAYVPVFAKSEKGKQKLLRFAAKDQLFFTGDLVINVNQNKDGEFYNSPSFWVKAKILFGTPTHRIENAASDFLSGNADKNQYVPPKEVEEKVNGESAEMDDFLSEYHPTIATENYEPKTKKVDLSQEIPNDDPMFNSKKVVNKVVKKQVKKLPSRKDYKKSLQPTSKSKANKPNNIQSFNKLKFNTPRGSDNSNQFNPSTVKPKTKNKDDVKEKNVTRTSNIDYSMLSSLKF